MPQSKREASNKLLSSLGLCARAGALVFGTTMVCEAMRTGGKKKPLLVLEASDTSGGTHKRLTDKCTTYATRHVRLACDGQTLAAALGKSASLAAVAICDENLCRMIDAQLAATEQQQH
ncbi:MAG: 50S ribosomal protein L7ae [Clostridia bacterium]|nr:50S ribosomal protein L7ae [Clostridia bacterium]